MVIAQNSIDKEIQYQYQQNAQMQGDLGDEIDELKLSDKKILSDQVQLKNKLHQVAANQPQQENDFVDTPRLSENRL